MRARCWAWERFAHVAVEAPLQGAACGVPGSRARPSSAATSRRASSSRRLLPLALPALGRPASRRFRDGFPPRRPSHWSSMALPDRAAAARRRRPRPPGARLSPADSQEYRSRPMPIAARTRAGRSESVSGTVRYARSARRAAAGALTAAIVLRSRRHGQPLPARRRRRNGRPRRGLRRGLGAKLRAASRRQSGGSRAPDPEVAAQIPPPLSS